MTARSDDAFEDEALARRIAAGDDADAARLLCRRLFPRIRAYGLRRLRDDAGAADLAQHVLVVVLEALRAGRVEEPDRLAAFVMGVCRNTVIEWKKVERRRSAVLEKYAASFDGVTEIAPVSVDVARLEHCLDELAPRDRTIIALTYFDERAADDIGRELSMSTGNVRVARHRALARLHACVTRGEA
ncbi:MAG: sigma-70 family RNA polymerase sigma factor [Labilithrix sp.]|nr:sigma-70 family RNA polymerase sigma factor [Labilithrix sp.]